MKNIPADLLADIEAGTVCTLILVTLTNGTAYGFTDHDAPLTVNGQTYVPVAGNCAIKLMLTSDASVSKQDMTSQWLPIASEQDLLEGLYDFAQVNVQLASWKDPSYGSVTIFAGRIGRISWTDQGFTASVFSNMWQLQQNIGIEFTANCRHKFAAQQDPQGVAGCLYNASNQIYDGAIISDIINAVEFRVGINATVPGTPNSPNAPSLSANAVFPSTSGGAQYLAPTEGTPYSYSVSAIVDGIESAPSPISSIYIDDTIVNPNELTWHTLFTGELPMDAIGATVTLNWPAVPNASAYNVYGRTSQTLLATVTGTTYTDNGSGSGGTVAPPYGDFFAQGFVTMTSGAANGLSREVKFCHSGKLQLWLPFERPVAGGDTFQIQVGCVKTTSACQYKFNNLVNFGGFPGIKPQVLYTAPHTSTGSVVKK